jgi:SPP1 gp7 family putative phage head morphogenesis protein
MAKNAKKQPAVKSDSNVTSVVINQIHIGQLERGNQTISRWMQNVKSAERIINPNRRYILETYLDISIDLHLDAVRNKRIRALKNVPFEWGNLTDEKYKKNLNSPWFYELLEIVGRYFFEGYKVVELIRGADGLIHKCVEIPPQNVKPEKKVITKEMWGSEEGGFQYDEPPFSNFILEIGKPTDLGLYMKIAPYILLKRDNLSDFAKYNEIFGMPLRWYEYDPTDPTAREQVTAQAEAQGAAAYVVVPKGTVVNFHEANKSGANNNYELLHRLLNEEVTIGVLGNTLTTSTEGKGSNALGKVHLQVENELAMEDRLFFELFANHVLKPVLIQHGYPLTDIDGAFVLTEEISMEKKLEMWLKMVDHHLPIAQEDFYEEFGVPLPEGRELVQPAVKPGAADPKAAEEENDPANKDKDDDEPGGAGAGKSNGSAKLTSGAVRELYAGQCKSRAKLMEVSLSFQGDLNDLIEEIIRKIYARELKAGDIDTELWNLISAEFETALSTVFAKVSSSGADAAMIAALKRDVQIFSGFKTYQFLREATDKLLTETGEIRAFTDFRTEILKLNETYNLDFLRTEYNHAIGAARMASKWADIVRTKELFPLLEYVTAGDNRVRQSHRKLDRIILPLDHPFWDTYMPPNDWNCRCNVRKLSSGEQTIIKPDDLPEIKDSFRFNPGKQGVIFPKNHPYYNIPEEDKGKIENSINPQ